MKVAAHKVGVSQSTCAYLFIGNVKATFGADINARVLKKPSIKILFLFIFSEYFLREREVSGTLLSLLWSRPKLICRSRYGS